MEIISGFWLIWSMASSAYESDCIVGDGVVDVVIGVGGNNVEPVYRLQ